MREVLSSSLSREEIFSQTFEVSVDRPIGTRHPKHGTEIVYPINYGEIVGLVGGDGEYQDVYILGVSAPLRTFRGRIVAIIHRLDDVEDKWVTCPEGQSYTAEEIRAAVDFQEKYYHSELTLRPEGDRQ